MSRDLPSIRSLALAIQQETLVLELAIKSRLASGGIRFATYELREGVLEEQLPNGSKRLTDSNRSLPVKCGIDMKLSQTMMFGGPQFEVNLRDFVSDIINSLVAFYKINGDFAIYKIQLVAMDDHNDEITIWDPRNPPVN